MKKSSPRKKPAQADEDTMRPEYDFSRGVRGTLAKRYHGSTRIVVTAKTKARSTRIA
jgi:hypothetical protein